MPIYEYRCTACAHELEVLQKISDDPLVECPECGGTLKRLVSAPNFRLKGSGWYETDFKSDGDTKRNLADKGDKKSTGEAKDAKPKSDGDGAKTAGASGGTEKTKSPPAKAVADSKPKSKPSTSDPA